jgi:hypothetical protein
MVLTVSEGPAFGMRIAARLFACGIEPDRQRIKVVVGDIDDLMRTGIALRKFCSRCNSGDSGLAISTAI